MASVAVVSVVVVGIPEHENVHMDAMVKVVDGEMFPLPSEYKRLLVQLREKLSVIINPDLHDDVFLWRFLVSKQVQPLSLFLLFF